MLDFLRDHTADDDRAYQILVENEGDGTYVATSPALPGYVAYATSEGAAVKKLRKAIQRNLEGFAKDWGNASTSLEDLVSRHRTRLHFGLPLTTTAKVVLSAAALATAAGLVKLAQRLHRD